MFSSTIIPLVAALAGPSPSQVERAEVTVAGDTVQVVALDGDGEVVAELVQWQPDGPDGEPRIDAVFPDGLALSVEFDGDEVSVISDDPDEAIARLVAIEDVLAETEQLAGKGTSGKCWLHLSVTVIGCAMANIPACLIGAVGTACACDDSGELAC
jgi:hypothetical protein